MSEESVTPYVRLLEGRDAAQVMRETLGSVEGLLSHLSQQAIDTRPAPEKWSVREVLCHMADCEVAWGWRLRQVYGEDRPVLQSFEQDPWARAYDGVWFTSARALSAWRVMREWNLALIETLSDADKARPAVHPHAGEVTLWTLVEIAAGHDLHHLKGLRKLEEAR